MEHYKFLIFPFDTSVVFHYFESDSMKELMELEAQLKAEKAEIERQLESVQKTIAILTVRKSHQQTVNSTESRNLENHGPIPPAPAARIGSVSPQEIRNAVLAMSDTFGRIDIVAALEKNFPRKQIPLTKVSTIIFLLKKQGKLKIVSEREGRNGAKYEVIK